MIPVLSILFDPRRRSSPVLLAVAAAMLLGCATQQNASTPAAPAAPTDLTVDVTVLVGRRVPMIDRVEQRNGRYIVFPDGSLHADAGPTLRADVRPGLTRRLRDDEARRVWTTLVDSGLADSERFGPPTNDALLVPPRDMVAHLVTIEADGDRWQVIRAFPPAASDSDAAAATDTSALVRMLAALAWESDTLPESMLPGGIRYEFGPDPHEAYRAVGLTPALRRRGTTEGR